MNNHFENVTLQCNHVYRYIIVLISTLVSVPYTLYHIHYTCVCSPHDHTSYTSRCLCLCQDIMSLLTYFIENTH